MEILGYRDALSEVGCAANLIDGKPFRTAGGSAHRDMSAAGWLRGTGSDKSEVVNAVVSWKIRGDGKNRNSNP